MAELIGTTIGVVGILGQLFDGCIKAYSYFTTAQHLDADSQKLICKVRIEEMRLLVWGREWGVAEGRLESHLRREEVGLREVAREILEQLHGTVTDVKRLKDVYGVVDGGEGGKGDGKGRGMKNGGKVERSWKKEIQLKSKWVISGTSFLSPGLMPPCFPPVFSPFPPSPIPLNPLLTPPRQRKVHLPPNRPPTLQQRPRAPLPPHPPAHLPTSLDPPTPRLRLARHLPALASRESLVRDLPQTGSQRRTEEAADQPRRYSAEGL